MGGLSEVSYINKGIAKRTLGGTYAWPVNHWKYTWIKVVHSASSFLWQVFLQRWLKRRG